jgi:hypothetical protein
MQVWRNRFASQGELNVFTTQKAATLLGSVDEYTGKGQVGLADEYKTM